VTTQRVRGACLVAPRPVTVDKARSYAFQGGLALLGLALCTLLGCATQVSAAGADGVAVQIGVTESHPEQKAMVIAQEHCAKYGKKAALQTVREQVIFDFACR
jgi:hypothetical protein